MAVTPGRLEARPKFPKNYENIRNIKNTKLLSEIHRKSLEILEISKISMISDEITDSETVHAGKGVLEDRWERARMGRGAEREECNTDSSHQCEMTLLFSIRISSSVREAAAGPSPMYTMTASSLGSISCLF